MPDFLSDPFLLSFFVAGVVLLVAGHRLLWLFAGIVGFFVGFSLAQTALPDTGLEVRLGLAVAAGLLAIGLVVFVEKVGVGLAGLGAGGLATHWLISGLGYPVEGLMWVPVAIGAGVGWWLSSGVFKLALALLTSVAGAALVLEAVGGGSPYQPLVLLALAAIGVGIQMLGGRKQG